MTYKTAWRMAHAIRKHMDKVNGQGPLSGIVEIDEAMLGGKRPGKRGRGAEGKTLLLGMVERGGNAVIKAAPDMKAATVYPAIWESVAKSAEMHTDRHQSYASLGTSGYEHKTVNHGKGEYVSGNCHVNSIEGFWFHLQKAIRGTHVSVSGKHLEKYAGEFSYRFNRRKSPAVMLPELLGAF